MECKHGCHVIRMISFIISEKLTTSFSPCVKFVALGFSSDVARRTCTVGADVASMTHTAKLSSANVLKNLAIAAVSDRVLSLGYACLMTDHLVYLLIYNSEMFWGFFFFARFPLGFAQACRSA